MASKKENTKPKEMTISEFEEEIKNYGSHIEHIETFVEAVRRFPGKPMYCSA